MTISLHGSSLTVNSPNASDAHVTEFDETETETIVVCFRKIIAGSFDGLV